jgi:hypothetical protein
MVISIFSGFGFVWVVHLSKLLISALGPLAGLIAALALGLLLTFAVFVLIVHLAPRLISPRLVLTQNHAITALHLAVGTKKDS